MEMATRLPGDAIDTLKPWFPAVEMSEIRVATEGPVSWTFRRFNRSAVTFGKCIYFTDRAHYDCQSPTGLALIAHEVKHVEQYARYGFLPFLARYLLHAAKLGFRYSERHPLEAEAYRLQREVLARLTPNEG